MVVVLFCVLLITSPVAGIGLASSSDATQQSALSPSASVDHDANVADGDLSEQSDIVVDVDGGADYTSIQNGVDNATEGDIVEVRPGTYEEPVDVSKNITLIAPDGANITNTSVVAGEYSAIESRQGLQIGGPATPQIAGFTLINWTVGVNASFSTGDWALHHTGVESQQYGVLATETDGNWTIANVTVDNAAGGIVASGSSGDWTVRDTLITQTDNGVVAENASGAWAIERSFIQHSASDGVEASNSTGDWTIKFSEIVDTRQAVEATNTTGAWEIHWSALVNSAELTIDARGAEIEGNATRNWWGNPDGPADEDFAGNVSVADPLPVPPNTIIGTLSAESGASLAGDTVAAYTGLDGEETEVFDAEVGEGGEFEIVTDRSGVPYTLAYADDDFSEERNGVPDLYAIGKTIAPEHVDPELPMAHNVSIRVTDQYENPIENADVAIEHRNGDAVVRENGSDVTNESGYVADEGSDGLEFVGNLTVEAEFRGVTNSTNVEVTSDREITVELSGATVNGTINTSTGSPEGDSVGAFTVTDDEIEGIDTTVDADGSFEIGGLSTDEEYTLAFGDHGAGETTNGVPDLYAIQRVSPTEGTTDIGEIDIPEAYNVSIRVVDRNGEAIEGADVAITHKNGDAVVEDGERNATNETGYLSPAGFPPLELAGNVTVWANYNGVNNSTNLRVNETTGDRNVVIELTRPAVSGTLDASGSVAGGTVQIYRFTEDGEIARFETEVESDGNFTISGGSADATYTLVFGDDESSGVLNGVPDLYAIQRVSPPADLGEVTIPEAHNVSIQVVGPNGEPVQNADGTITHTNGDAIVEEGRRDATNETGYVSAGEDTTFEFVGDITAYAQFRGVSNSTNATVTGDRTGSERIVIQLPGVAVNGTVTDADGDAVPNSSVVYDGTEDGDDAFWTRAVTDENGTYRTQLLPGDYRVRFRQTSENITFPIDGVPDIYGVGEIAVEDGTQNDISLPRGNRLQIQVTNGTEPLANSTVEIVHLNPNGGASGVEVATNDTGWVHLGGTSGVEVNGSVDVELESERYYAERSLTVDSDDTIVLEAQELINVTGNVTNASDGHVTDGEVFARATDGLMSADAPIEENGEYELVLVPNTTYELGFRQDGEGTEVDFATDGIPDIQSLTVVETGSEDLQVPTQQLGVGHPFDITVKTPDGSNASDVTVFVSDNDVQEDFALGIGGETNENGSFVLYSTEEPGIELNGSIDIYVDPPEGSGLGDASRQDIVVDEPGSITIQLEEAATVSGTILQPDGETPAADERIQVNAAEDDRRAGDTVRTNETGFFDAQVPLEGSYHVGFVQADEGTEARPPYPQDGVPDFYAIANVSSGAETDLGTVTLPEPHNLTVNVVGPNDEFVQDATVRLWSIENDAYQWGGETTVEDGSLTVEVNGSVGIEARPPDGVDLRSEYERIEVTSDRTVNVTLDPNVTVSGEVDYADGTNVSGYTMELFGDGGDHRLTDENGSFELYPASNRTYALGFKQTDWEGGKADFPKDGRPDLHTFRGVEVGDEDRSVGDLTLSEAHLVNITVENANGEPVPDAVVDLNAISRFAGSHHSGTTRDDGEVVLSGSDAPGIEVNGTLRVHVRSTGPYASNTSIYEIDGDREVTVVLRERVDVSGQLVNESGAGLTGFDVVASESDGVYISASNRSNATGNFSIPVGANETYSITAVQRNAETDTIGIRDDVTDLYELTVVETDATDEEIGRQTVPPAAGVLNVTVENESGTPVEDAVVSIVPNQSGVAGVSSVQLSRPTDEDGYLVVGGKRGFEAAGEYIVRAYPPNSDAYVDEVNVTTVNVTGDETVTLTLNETDTTQAEPDISIQGVTLLENEITTSEPVAVDVTLENQGDADGSDIDVKLTSDDGTISTSETITVQAGDTATAELRTTVETAGEYDLTVSAAGVSASAGTVNVTEPPEPANVTLTNVTVSPKTITAGESVTINATVENTGDVEGNITLGFYNESNLIYEQTVNVSGGSTEVVGIEQPFTTAGTYNISVANQSEGGRVIETDPVIVEEQRTETGTGAPGFGFAPAILGLLGAALVLYRRR